MSIIIFETCPQCKSNSLRNEFVSNGENIAVCICCGYGAETKRIANDNLRFEIDKDGWKIIESNERYKLISKKFKGYGVIRYANIHAGSETCPLACQLTSEGHAEILENFAGTEIDKNRCYLTTWDEEEKRVVVLFGALPTEEIG